jgi:hypothetical protein
VAGTLQNSQCSVDAAASSFAAGGNTLTVSLALTFKPAFAGAKTNFMTVSDMLNQTPGWLAKGTWTVTGGVANLPPTANSVTPASGSGSSQTFTYSFSDPNGFADIVAAEMLIHATLSASNSCFMHYDRASNHLFLVNDSGVGSTGPVTLGVVGTLQNSQCIVNAGASSVTPSGNNLTVNVALTFKPAFSGVKTNFMTVSDTLNQTPGWLAKGIWTAP